MSTPLRSLRRAALMAALALCLPACSPSLTKPQPPSPKPLPPRVDCKQAWADAPGKAPRDNDPVQWQVYARLLLGGWLVDRQNRLKEHGCLDRLKAAGEIR